MVIPLLCGLGAGILSAWGVGGGTLLLLAMTLFLGVDQQTAQGINLLFFLPTAATALLTHAKSGLLDKNVLRSAAPASCIGALAGALAATFLSPDLLRKPFGLYLLYAGISLIWPKKKK